MKSIAIYNTSLQMGGISKSLICFLKLLQSKDYEVDVYLFDERNDFECTLEYENIKINIIKVNSLLARRAAIIPFSLMMLLNYRNISDKLYDYVIDYNGYNNLCAALALKTRGYKHMIWVHNDYYKRYKMDIKFRLLWHLSNKKFSEFDNIVAVSKGALEGFEMRYKGIINSSYIIPNLIDVEEIVQQSKEAVNVKVNMDKYLLVSVGNLNKAKQVTRQIEIINEVKKYRDDICLYVIGDGKEKKRLKEMVKKLHLEEVVIFVGRQANPYKYMKIMDGLILTSAYEGQGIVVREAQVLGLDLYIDSNLEKYNERVEVSRDLVHELLYVKKKKERRINYLSEYLEDIEFRIVQLLK